MELCTAETRALATRSLPCNLNALSCLYRLHQVEIQTCDGSSRYRRAIGANAVRPYRAPSNLPTAASKRGTKTGVSVRVTILTELLEPTETSARIEQLFDVVAAVYNNVEPSSTV